MSTTTLEAPEAATAASDPGTNDPPADAGGAQAAQVAQAQAKPERPKTLFLIFEPAKVGTDEPGVEPEPPNETVADPPEFDLSTWRHVGDQLAHDRNQALRQFYGEPGDVEVICCAVSEVAWNPVKRKPRPRVAVETEAVAMPAATAGQ